MQDFKPIPASYIYYIRIKLICQRGLHKKGQSPFILKAIPPDSDGKDAKSYFSSNDTN